MNKTKSIFVQILAAIGCVFVVFLITVIAFVAKVSHDTGLAQSLVPLFKSAYYLGELYVDPIDPATTTKRLLAGLVDNLDPHTSYMPPEATKKFQNEMQGGYGGIGVGARPTQDNKALFVKDLLDNGPAHSAGINVGDYIVSIDGTPVAQKPWTSNMEKIRGPIGTTVNLGVARLPNGPSRSIQVKRMQIKPPTAQWGYVVQGSKKYLSIRLVQFNLEAVEQTMNAIIEARENYSGQIAGIIFDLRDNPGGLVDSAVAISSLFLADDSLVVTSKGNGTVSKWSTTAKDWADDRPDLVPKLDELKAQNPWLRTAPMVVLVNRRSASASEIMAGALKDWGRAIIVGNTTFGKGSIQTVVNLGENYGSMKITHSRYYTPKGHAIQAQGVRPDHDIASPSDTGTREADLPMHLTAEHDKAGTSRTQPDSAPKQSRKPPREEPPPEDEMPTFARRLEFKKLDPYFQKAASILQTK